MDGNIFGDDAAAKAESLRQFTQLIRAVHGGNPDETAAVVEMRCLYRGTDKRKRKTVHKWATAHMISGLHDELCELNDAGYCIFYGVNPRKESGGTTAEDVEIGTAQCIDIDNGCTTEQLLKAVAAAGLPEPSLVVETGGGCQAVWPLNEPTPVAEWCARQVGINAAVEGADSVIKDAPRIMRAPGFRNRKPERGPDFPMARLVVESDTRHDPTAFPEGNVYTPPVLANGEPVPGNIVMPKGELPKFATAFLERGGLLPPKGKEQPSRRETAYRVAIEMKAAGIDAGVASTRICARLYALGLDETAVEDFRNRQLANAYGQERTPTIDPERLPRTIPSTPKAEPEITITANGSGKHIVAVKRGIHSHIDAVDLTKHAARTKFLRAAGEALGEGTDLDSIDARMKAVALGDEQPNDAEPLEPRGFKPEDFISLANMVRPERFAVAVGDEVTAGTTVARYHDGEDGPAGMWLTFLVKHDGTREAVELPLQVTVGETVFHTFPRIPPPPVSPELGWSEPSQWNWLETGQATMAPATLFHDMVAAFERFLEIHEDARQGTLETLALWVVSTYLAEQFEVIAYLAITGPKGSGKSRTMHCLNQVAFRSHLVANPTAAVLFRHIHVNGGTVIVDEAENLQNADPTSGLHQTLLTSNTRGMSVPRCEGEDNTPTNFQVYAPKAFISIAEPNEPLLDRAIHFRMFRADKGSPKAVLHPKSARHRRLWQRLRDGLNTMVLTYAKDFLELPDAETVVPSGLNPRTMETWAPLLQIAAVLEGLGVAGLLERMQAFARGHGQAAEVNTVPVEHETLLRAFVSLRATGKATTSSAVLARAYAEGMDAQVRMPDKAVGNVLACYGLKHGAGRKRREWVATDGHLARIQAAYGIQLDVLNDDSEKISGGTPLENVSHVSPSPKNAVSPVEKRVFDGDTNGDGDTSTATAVCHIEGNGTVMQPGDTPGVQSDCHRHTSVTGSVTPKTLENKGETNADGSGDTCDTPTKGSSDNISGKVIL
jgi:hypothetical protein